MGIQRCRVYVLNVLHCLQKNDEKVENPYY